jgi:hypothetical protein
MVIRGFRPLRDWGRFVKVIETTFDGYRFRSRTEARWAVFFRACAIRYEYEIEGYGLGGGVWYLPDFWLPDLDRWFEVKGKFPSEHERDKCWDLALETGHEALIAVGPPNPEVEQLIRVYPTTDFTVPDQDWREWRAKSWRRPTPTKEYEDGWQFADDCARDGTFWLNSEEFGAACIGPHKDKSTDDLPKVARSVTARGFSAARSARFGQ